MKVAAFALLLLAVTDEDPATTWARLLDPSIPTAERIEIAKTAKLPPEYLPRIVAFEVAYDDGTGRGDMKRIVEHLQIPTTGVDAYALVRGLPCRTHSEGLVVIETLRRFPMNAETYGVVRNFVVPRSEEFFPRDVPAGWSYRNGDDWNAAQAFIIETSAPHETDGRMAITEPIATVSRMMYDLEHMLATMHPHGSKAPFPATAFLALADRVAHESGTDGYECMLHGDAARLLAITDDPPFSEEGASSLEACRRRIDTFRDWLEEHRGELEAIAGKEAADVEDARRRMQRVTLCRP